MAGAATELVEAVDGAEETPAQPDSAAAVAAAVAAASAPQPAPDAERQRRGKRPTIYSPTGWRATNPAELRTSGCHPMPLLPSPGPAASWVSQRSPATYMNTWSALA